MPWVGFEPTIPEFEREKMVHALDRAATVIGNRNPTPAFTHRFKAVAALHTGKNMQYKS
jgi:hypothetical protein